MAQPTSQATLLSYIKSRLGYPVITINVTDTQINERIDDALALWQDYHYDATTRTFLKHQITASNLHLTVASTGTFTNGEFVIGATSNVYGVVVTQTSANLISFTYNEKPLTNTFTVGETVTGSNSGATGVISTVVLGDWDNEYIPTGNTILSVMNMLRPKNQYGLGGSGERSTGLFSYTFPMIAGSLGSFGAGSAGGEMTSYYLTKSHLEMMHDILQGDTQPRFNRHQNRIYLDTDWSNDFRVGDWVAFEVHQLLDPDTYTDIWSDRFVRDYSTALVKKQWGQNLMKFQGVQMVGGVTLNGKEIYDEGTREAEELEESIQRKYERPLGFFFA